MQLKPETIVCDRCYVSSRLPSGLHSDTENTPYRDHKLRVRSNATLAERSRPGSFRCGDCHIVPLQEGDVDILVITSERRGRARACTTVRRRTPTTHTKEAHRIVRSAKRTTGNCTDPSKISAIWWSEPRRVLTPSLLACAPSRA